MCWQASECLTRLMHCVLRPQAHIVFKPNLQQQRKCHNCTDSAIDGAFTVLYDVSRDSNAGELQVSHAHFNRGYHITPTLASLHRLPDWFRIDLKILLITVKARLGLCHKIRNRNADPI